MNVYFTPFLNCVVKTTISKYSGSACVPLCTPRLRWYSPMDSHTFSMGSFSTGSKFTLLLSDCLNCNSDSVAPYSGRPRNINGPFWLSCASHHAVDYPTALSVVRLALSDTRPSLANLSVDRINRMRSSRHVVLWDCVGERSGGRTIDTYIARNSLLASTDSRVFTFQQSSKMVLPCYGLVQGRASILVTRPL